MALPRIKAVRPILLVLIVSCSGCLPAIAHGPRVEPGASVGVSAAYATGPTDQSDIIETPIFAGALGVNVGAGVVSERPGRPAARLGFHVPVPFVLLMQSDLYVQAPTGMLGALDGGAGVAFYLAAPTRILTPYVQLGRMDAGGSGWYTTQGLYLVRDPGDTYRHDLSHLTWVSSLAYRAASGPTATHFFVTGALGRDMERCDRYSGTCEPAVDRWVLASGLTLEYLIRPRPRAPPR